MYYALKDSWKYGLDVYTYFALVNILDLDVIIMETLKIDKWDKTVPF